jgi:hypothetical protein
LTSTPVAWIAKREYDPEDAETFIVAKKTTMEDARVAEALLDSYID